MKRRMIYSVLVIFFLCFLLLIPPVSPSKATPSLSPSQSQIENILQDQSSFFTENKGQWDPAILFVGDTSFGKVAFTREAVYYQLIKVTETEESIEKEPQGKEETIRLTSFPGRNLSHGIREENERIYESQVVKLSFVEGKGSVIRGENPLSHYHNYFIGNDPKKWASYCKNYAKVYYEDIWEGINLAYFFTSEGMKYEYYVEPEADICKLRIQIDGAKIINTGKAIELKTSNGSIYDKQLLAFTQYSNKHIGVQFITKSNQLSFILGNTDFNETLVIDPLIYSSYIGGNSSDSSFGMEIDSSGNIIMIGYTMSTDFPITKDAINKKNSGKYDIFLCKYDPSCQRLLYSTFIGGSDSDSPFAVSIDQNDNIGITGATSSRNFPITRNRINPALVGLTDVFVVKINKTGDQLILSTYIGGRYDDFSNDIIFDRDSSILVTGATESSDFPIIAGSFNKKHNGGFDAFVLKLDEDGSKLLFSGFLGGKKNENKRSSGYGFGNIGLDSDGNIYVFGITSSPNFPTTENAFQPDPNFKDSLISESIDFFLSKLDNLGKTMIYSTYFGGSETEKDDYDLAYNGFFIDSENNILVTGCTTSDDFPVTENAYDKKKDGLLSDAFLSKFSPDGALIFSTYLGSSNHDFGYNISTDSKGNYIVAGTSMSKDFIEFNNNDCIKQSSSTYDTFVTIISKDGAKVLYSDSFFGEKYDYPTKVIGRKDGSILCCGVTDSQKYPITPDAFKKTKKEGTRNGFLTIITPDYYLPPEKPRITFQKNTVTSISIETQTTTKPCFIKEAYLYKAEFNINNPVYSLFKTASSISTLIIDDNLVMGKSCLYYLEIEDIYGNKSPPSNILLVDLTFPKILIESPENNSFTNKANVLLQFSANDLESGLQSIVVNGIQTTITSEGNYSFQLSLREGNNQISIVAIVMNNQKNNQLTCRFCRISTSTLNDCSEVCRPLI